jgi:hypothetical protein
LSTEQNNERILHEFDTSPWSHPFFLLVNRNSSMLEGTQMTWGYIINPSHLTDLPGGLYLFPRTSAAVTLTVLDVSLSPANKKKR